MQLIYEDKQRRIIKSQEEITFSNFSSFHLIVITARVKSEKQISEGATDDEDLTIVIDNKTFPKLNNPTGVIDSPAAFSGGRLHNLSKTVYFLTFLKGRKHQIELKTDKPTETATFEGIEIYLLSTLHLEEDLPLKIESQAEDGERRPWITFTLDNLPLKSFTPTITYSHRKRDSDDVKIIIDGKTYGNLLRNIRYFLWRYVGSLLPKLFPTRTKTETFTVNLPQGLHYLELEVDRMPILNKLMINFGIQPSISEGVPTVHNPKWTEDFYEDTEEMLLARAIYGEVGGELRKAKIGVGWAIRNRVEDSLERWGKNYHQVILAKGQYDSLWNKWTYDKVRNPPVNEPKEKTAWEESYNSARNVIRGKVDDPTKGANHFYATSIPKPDWADESRFTMQIGITRFYKL